MRTLTRVLVGLAAFFAATSVALASPDAIVSLPDSYKATEQALVAGCGQDRARAIANLSWDVEIHQDWLAVVTSDPSRAKTVGDANWHRYWIKAYQQTITLLLADCK